MNKKAFITTVGSAADGIVFSIKQQNPSHIYFIVTLNSEKTVEKIKKLLKNTENFTFKNLLLEEENDVEKIFLFCKEKIEEILATNFDEEDIVIDYTGGTKAMSAGLVLAGILKRVKTLSYVYGEREEKSGRVQSGSERINPFEPKQIFDEILMSQIKFLFNTYQFYAINKLIDKDNHNRKHHPSQEEEFKLILDLAKAHDYWDKFQIKDAHQLFSEISTRLRENENQEKIKIKNQINKINRWLAHVNKNESYVAWDILYNAKRRAEEGKFDDAVARLYRAIEKVIQIEYRKEFNEDTNNGLRKTLEEVSTKKDNKIVQKFKEHKDDLEKLLTIRNQSILAHGLTPITKDKFKKMWEVAEKLICPKEKIEFIKF